jgi:hypothetical protein
VREKPKKAALFDVRLFFWKVQAHLIYFDSSDIVNTIKSLPTSLLRQAQDGELAEPFAKGRKNISPF